MVEEKREDLHSSPKDNNMDTKIFDNIEVDIPNDTILTTEAEATEALSFINTSKKFCDIDFSNKIYLDSSNSSLDDDAIIVGIKE